MTREPNMARYWRGDPPYRYAVVHNEIVDTLREIEAAPNRHARRAVIARRRAARKTKA